VPSRKLALPGFVPPTCNFDNHFGAWQIRRFFMPKLKLYTKSYCPYCDQARMILESAGVNNYEEISIDGNQLTMRKELFKLTGGRWDVPQAFVDDRYIGDDDDLRRLAKTGELSQMLD
tara:strand:+ start:1216 stop:1569 length:354 start_codon:yes stop_codon:yes gene_type:complete